MHAGEPDARTPLLFPHLQWNRRFLGSPCATSSPPADPFDPSPSAAASAAGGRGIDGSRRVYSLGVRGVLAGGAVVVAAWLEWLLSAAVLPSASGSPVEALGGSGAFWVPAALRSRRALLPEPPSVMAVVALGSGILRPPSRRVDLLLAQIGWSLQVGFASSSMDAVGFAEDGGCFRSGLRRETATAPWRCLGADVRSPARF